MDRYDYNDDYYDLDYYNDEYYEDDYYNTSFKANKKNKRKKFSDDELFVSKSGKKKKKEYKRLQKEKERMKIDAVNSLFGDYEDEE